MKYSKGECQSITDILNNHVLITGIPGLSVQTCTLKEGQLNKLIYTVVYRNGGGFNLELELNADGNLDVFVKEITIFDLSTLTILFNNIDGNLRIHKLLIIEYFKKLLIG